jgi:hypothetical protein
VAAEAGCLAHGQPERDFIQRVRGQVLE